MVALVLVFLASLPYYVLTAIKPGNARSALTDTASAPAAAQPQGGTHHD